MIIRKPGTTADEVTYKRKRVLAKLTKEERELLGLSWMENENEYN